MATVDELKRLSKLHQEGALSAPDFAAARADLLSRVQEAEFSDVEDRAPRGEEECSANCVLLTRSIGGAILISIGFWLMGATLLAAGAMGVMALGVITWSLYRGLDPEG